MAILPFWREPQSADAHRRATQAFAKKEILGQALCALLDCIGELSLDLTEIGSEELKAHMDELTCIVRADELSAKLEPALEKGEADILAYAKRARTYVTEREAELRRIVTLLTSGMRSLGQDNDHFNHAVQTQAGRLERISQLGDIRQVRQELHHEVTQLREAVVQKRRVDTAQMSSLHREVEQLRGAVDQARSAALRDGLTGLGNRVAFDLQLKRLIEPHGEEAVAPFSLLLIDVDHFKVVNDTHGHPIGDRVLIALAQTCRDQFRRDDFIGRYGGEEFVVLMPGAPASVALKKAKRLCKEQRKLAYAIDADTQVSFTVTVGVAEYKEGDTTELILARADAALYAGKHQGRDRALSAA